ncbi:hypothetical protein [Spiroplasma endosymbiont of Panzeria rudis]
MQALHNRNSKVDSPLKTRKASWGDNTAPVKSFNPSKRILWAYQVNG